MDHENAAISGGIALTFETEDISEKPVLLHIEASDEERAALVQRFDIVDISRLVGDIALSKRESDGAIIVEGRIDADLSQRCVATLEPVSEHVSVDLYLLLVSEDIADAWDDQELYLDDSYPEYDAYVEGSLPVGEIVAQTVSIHMEPYPRAEGVELEAQGGDVTVNEELAGKPNPFAVLSKLKDKS